MQPEAPMPTLAIQLPGNFRLTWNGTLVNSVNSSWLQSLLAYRVLHRDAPQSRQPLAFDFWPDSSEARSHNNLRQLPFELRRALPYARRFLDGESATVQWRTNARFTCDILDFEHTLAKLERTQDVCDALEGAI